MYRLATIFEISRRALQRIESRRLNTAVRRWSTLRKRYRAAIARGPRRMTKTPQGQLVAGFALPVLSGMGVVCRPQPLKQSPIPTITVLLLGASIARIDSS